ncbi:ECF transporter S component [Angustibacter sp. Root456]|uniref:ECF transporter S component n=1 Tax=Angustibacter sp. Root456 TaxID=1736539 RepID=UPI0006F94E0E|nr:ECF transporter S component [Angustibacter sp. Root456]KQX62001.1 ABC transporter permease [Angustibacter sp. Root456]
MTAPAVTSRPSLGELTRWRTVDLVTAAMLGVAFGVAYWGWSAAYTVVSPAFTAVPALGGLLGGPWLLAGVVGGLVVRRPGAALLAELVAANVEYLLGNQWGVATLVSGLLQGLGVEIVLAIFLFRRFGPGVAALSAALAATLETAYEYFTYDYATTFGAGGTVLYLVTFMLSGVLLAGLLGWLIVRALTRSGALAAFPAGREQARARDAELQRNTTSAR